MPPCVLWMDDEQENVFDTYIWVRYQDVNIK